MSTFFSETAAAWLCLAAVVGGTILCKVQSRPGQQGKKVVCLAGLWGGACLLCLSLFWGFILFSLACFLTYHYLSGQALLPVDQKAILITGKWVLTQGRSWRSAVPARDVGHILALKMENPWHGVNESSSPSGFFFFFFTTLLLLCFLPCWAGG